MFIHLYSVSVSQYFNSSILQLRLKESSEIAGKIAIIFNSELIS